MVWNRFECDGHGEAVTRGSYRETPERERGFKYLTFVALRIDATGSPQRYY